MKKVSRLLKLSGGKGKAVEKQQHIYCTQFVLIQAPQATHSSPRQRKEHKRFKNKNSILTFSVQQSQMIHYH